MTAILGISAFYHDSAAAIIVDGKIVAAAQEERFTRRKHDPDFPTRAVAYCLREAGLGTDQLDYIAFYEKPLAKFDRLLETYLAYAPSGFPSFRLAMPVWLKNKLHLRRAILNGLGGKTQAKLVFTEHHESHAASAFFPSPYQEAAILTLDGVGEWSTTAFGMGIDNKIDLTHHITFPHSIGLLYSAFTTYCGFKVNSGEYKLMGLAPYGRPVYRELILENLIDLKADGGFQLNMEYFEYCQGLTMTSRKFHSLFGGDPRHPESNLEQRHMDLAASIQDVASEIILRISQHVHATTGMRHLTLAGRVALNCVANGRLLREGPFDSIWVQPAAGDAGGALGAALFIWYQLLGHKRTALASDSMQGAFLGPRYESVEIARVLKTQGVAGRVFAKIAERDKFIAKGLADGLIVGVFQGRMEFGPRALGGRSILGDPRQVDMQAKMNLKIKFRESFRPFAPCVLAESASEWFELRPQDESPYMLLVADVLEAHRVALDPEDMELMATDSDLRKRVNVVRSTVPAVTHIDNSARVQTVDPARNPGLHGILEAFRQLTGCPILINTSFNVRGEPIVGSPLDAYRCFLGTGMDMLVLENTILLKSEMETALLDESEQSKYLARFELD